VDLFEEHRAAGREVVLVSSSGEEVVGPIGEMLGVDRVIATRMIVEEGRYTGDIAFYAYGENKRTAIAELSTAEGWDLADCYAYSDSATDVPMLEAVGHPFAVNPDKALRKAAAERDWPVLVFAKPVRARSRRVPSAPSSPWAYAGMTAVGGLALLAWFVARRSDRVRS
jgi:phosphoserine phosphatase